MKQYQFLYDNQDSFLEKLLEIKKESDSIVHGDMTFYITWMNDVQENADNAFNLIEKTFPNAICYGNESSGNINMGDIAYGVSITCYLFEEESSKTELVWIEQGKVIETLEDLWAYCRKKENLRAVELISSIAYLDLLHIEGNRPDLDEKITIFGGVSCNYFNPFGFSGILASGHPRTTSGVAAILYSGDDLSFETTNVLGWKTLGQKMKVTKAAANCIYEINNKPAFENYEHYLGLTVEDSDSFVFPLMVTEGNYDFIRTPRAINPDKSMLMFANIPEGTSCSIAYGNKNTILSSISETANTIAQLNPQAIKVFSCGGRRLFWGDNDVGKETKIIQNIAPVSGFYTGGEIVRLDNKVRVLNHTLAITTISEGKDVDTKTKMVFDEIDKSLVARLAYFAEVIADEQAQEQQKLRHDMEIISGLASQYETLYLINFDTGLYVNYGSSDDSHDTGFFKQISSTKELIDYAKSSDLIHPSYLDDFIAFFSDEKSQIKNNKTATFLFKWKYGDEYLWIRALLVKCQSEEEEPHHAVLGFKECDEEVRRDETIHKFTDVLERGQNPDDSINNILDSLSDYYYGDMAFVMELNNAGNTIECTYVWDNKNNLSAQNMSYDISSEYIDKLVKEFDYKGYILHQTDNAISKGFKKFLTENGKKSYLLVPLKQNDTIIGFVGVCDPRKSTDDPGVGKIASAVINSEIMRRKENDEEHITLGKISDSFVSVHYVNLESNYIHSWKQSNEYSELSYESNNFSETVAKFFNTYLEKSERERLAGVTNPQYVINQFKNTDHFSLEVTTSVLNKEMNLVFDFIRVTDDGKQFVLSCRDITEITKKQIEHRKELQEALDMAKSADRAKTEFLFNMSHDIRTPMNAILGFTDIAMRHFNEKEKAMESLLKIRSSGRHLLHLINDILEMSRIESGKFELEDAPLDVRESIRSVENMTKALAAPKSIDYQVIIEDIKNPYIYADELHINEVIVNLISNAIKYTPEDGKVNYIIRQLSDVKDGKVVYQFEISDNGIGMSEEFQKHLFEAFSREKSSTVSKLEGAGLGLSIVKRIVTLAGGTIKVNSKLGEGSTFIVEIPFRVVEDEKIAEIIPESKQNSDIAEDVVLEGKRVLLVEDNELNREIADEILSEIGIKVEIAENGQMAVDMVKEKGVKYYDFILMDIQMPVLDGYGATKAIRELPNGKDVIIIAVSANAFEEDKQKSLSMGMNAHVAKPIDVAELFRAMHELT